MFRLDYITALYRAYRRQHRVAPLARLGVWRLMFILLSLFFFWYFSCHRLLWLFRVCQVVFPVRILGLVWLLCTLWNRLGLFNIHLMKLSLILCWSFYRQLFLILNLTLYLEEVFLYGRHSIDQVFLWLPGTFLERVIFPLDKVLWI